MAHICVTPTEIKVNDVYLNSLDNIGFTYDYLYYEPDVPNMFKYIKNKDSSTMSKIDLTDEEKKICASFVDSFTPEASQIVDIPTQPEDNPDPSVFYVNADGTAGNGTKPRSQLLKDEVEITEAEFLTNGLPDEPKRSPSKIWNPVSRKFEWTTYFGRRWEEFNLINNGSQLDEVWHAINAIQKATGTVFPQSVVDLMNSRQAIKDKYPKE